MRKGKRRRKTDKVLYIRGLRMTEKEEEKERKRRQTKKEEQDKLED